MPTSFEPGAPPISPGVGPDDTSSAASFGWTRWMREKTREKRCTAALSAIRSIVARGLQAITVFGNHHPS
jgi:hypothetical protein